MVASQAAMRPSTSRTAGILSVPLAWQMRLATPTISPIFDQNRMFDWWFW